MAKESLSEIRAILQGLLEFQVKNALNQDDLLLFLGLLNVTMAMNLLEKRVQGKSDTPTAVSTVGDPLAALGQLLGEKRHDAAGLAAPLAGLLGRGDANLPALLSNLAGLLKPPGTVTPAGAGDKTAPQPPPDEAENPPAAKEEARIVERFPLRSAGRRDPLHWEFGKK